MLATLLAGTSYLTPFPITFLPRLCVLAKLKKPLSTLACKLQLTPLLLLCKPPLCVRLGLCLLRKTNSKHLPFSIDGMKLKSIITWVNTPVKYESAVAGISSFLC